MENQNPGMQMQPMQQPMMGQPPMQNQMAMDMQGGLPPDAFAAKPRVIRPKKYRDPYREYV